jgi:signal transduction histidine kinase
MQDVFPEDIPLIHKNLEAHFHGGAPKYEAIYRVRHKDGHDVWVQGTGRVVERDAEGNPVRMLGVALDISERKQSESTMEALHDEMNAMLVWQVAQHTVAALAHEINQPLASASILCEAVSRMVLANDLSAKGVGYTPNRPQETLKHIASEIERAGTVLRSLLISVNKPDITRATEVVNELVGESIQTALGEGVFGYQIIKDFTADLPLVKVNRLQVSKVLLNLIHNGAQAMQGAQTVKGKIVVSTALVNGGGEICVSVQDDGPGISALMQQEIFQPYISTKSHGLGLGLTISRALIEAHGGKLWATQVEGQGATFHFTLPTAG